MVAIVAVFINIAAKVETIFAEAKQEFAGDDIEALVAYLDSNTHSLQEKNHTVWALGRLRDKRALPVLESLYTGEPCQHQTSLCQQELKKAIDACKG